MNAKLWKKNAIGIGWWKIQVFEEFPSQHGILTISHAVSETAAAITHEERITQGKNIGRANETTPHQQALLEAESRVNKQLDKGYVREKPAWTDTVTNQLGQLKPMLAQPLAKAKKKLRFEAAYAQPKLDGFRCLAVKGAGPELVMYTRNGKQIDTLPHIRQRLLEIMHPGDHFDGELYLHGTPLQTIASWVKREQESSVRIEYHVYDMILSEPFALRQNLLRQRFEAYDNSGVQSPLPNCVTQVWTHPVEEMDEVVRWFRHWRDLHYEGAILRWGHSPYEDGKRSHSLVKIKQFDDGEYKVLDIVPGKTTSLNGNEVTPGIAVCEDATGKQFRCPLPGTLPEREQTLRHKDMYIGKMLTVQYANLTPDGIPFHPVGLRFRMEL